MGSRFVPPGGGEAVADRAERTVAIIGEHELLDVTRTRYESGERGPEPHVHRRHTDAFYVLSGELEFVVGADTVIAAPAGTLVVVPAGVVHTFGNESGATATFLNIHAPSCGFAAYLRDPSVDFDAEDPPAGGGRDPADVVVRGPGEGDLLPLGALFKAQRGDGDSSFYLGELTLPPGYPGPLPHRHAAMVDSFYVLDGTLDVRLGEQVQPAPAGSYAFVPPGDVHTFSNPSAA